MNYKTKDLATIAILSYFNYPVIETLKEGREIYFIFEDKGGLESLLTELEDNKLLVEPNLYMFTVKQVRTKINRLLNEF